MKQHLLHACDHPTAHRPLALLAIYRLATTIQLTRLTTEAYGSLSSAVRWTLHHLVWLQEHDLVTRLEQWAGGWQGGSTVSIWTLTIRGCHARAGGRSRQHPRSLSTSFLAHSLVITETSIQITETARPITDASATITIEPGYWRPYLGLAEQQLTLWPDLHAVITSSHYDDHYFIKVDRDTKSPTRVLTTCQRYAAYYVSGAEWRVCDVFPLILWVMPNAMCCQQLRRVIASDQRPPAALFVVITNRRIGETIQNGVAAR